MEENMQYDDLGTLAQLNWFPGHMAKAKRIIVENLKLVDVVIELRDARIPNSSANPILKDLIGKKPHLIALNKIDLADNNINNKWEEYFTSMGKSVVKINSLDGKGIRQLVTVADELAKVKTAKFANKGVKPRNARVMIVGIPNVGKSTFINKIAKRKAAAVGNKPGVTKSQQIIRVDKDFELFDTPGVLEPKFTDINKAMNVALCGSIKMEILPLDDLFIHAIGYLAKHYPEKLKERYNLTIDLDSDWVLPVYDHISDYRHIKKLRGETDYDRVQETFFNDLKNASLGRITWELSDE